MIMNTIEHYDKLIDENNDPVRDPDILKEHMNKWDGKPFIDALELSKDKIVLEIGIGAGRIAVKTAPHCAKLYGIDVSSKTINRAKENLSSIEAGDCSFIPANLMPLTKENIDAYMAKSKIEIENAEQAQTSNGVGSDKR